MGAEDHRVFVYGTLRVGGEWHRRLAGAGFLGPATARGRLYRIDWYPGLVLDPAGGEVLGDVFSVSCEQLAVIDGFEGIPAGVMAGEEYRRVSVRVRMVDGAETEAWTWEWIGAVDEARRLDSGDWLDAAASES